MYNLSRMEFQPTSSSQNLDLTTNVINQPTQNQTTMTSISCCPDFKDTLEKSNVKYYF